MPRPGPRPYECIRRPWHHDRHQPLRGSIISQIFRVVAEAHSSATRKNREWLEKLPTVVIKAEEIMYSKATSEAEYLDPDTLWDRLNDAIDTIIRKEETVETGQYLQPCIEAALVLGCVPVRARHGEGLTNLRSYLHDRVQKTPPKASAFSEKPVIERQPIQYTSVSLSNQLSIARPATRSSIAHMAVDNVMPRRGLEPNHSLKTRSVCPLCYGSTNYQNLSSQSIPMRKTQNTGNVIVGTPICCSSQICTTRELFPSAIGACTSDKIRQDNQAEITRIASVMGCDLSLSLGRNFDPPSVERRIQNHRAGFLPGQTCDGHFEPCSSRWATSDGEVRDVSAILRKRKLSFSHDADEGSISQKQQRIHSRFPGQTRWPGL